MIRVLIADDHTLFRQGLKEILADVPDIVVAGEAANAQEVLDLVWQDDYDILILDISLPGRSGLDIIKQLKNDKPDLSILVMSMHSEEQFAVRAFRAGAAGYLTKASCSRELIAAIRKVIAGGRYVNEAIAEKLAIYLASDAEKPPHEKLSNREYQIMCMIASGSTVKEIARTLSLSITTISTYRSRILEKMRMTRNAELTHYAIKHGLIE